MIKFRDYFEISLIEEATKLTYFEFAKPKTEKRPDRKAIFLDKYKNGQPFRINKNGADRDVIFDIKQDIIEKIENLTVGNPNKKSEEFKAAKSIYDSIVLSDVTSPGDTYSLNDLVKAGEFTGRGSGAGADNTKLNEASVCLWAAVYQEAQSASYDIVRRLANESSVVKYYDIDEDIDKILTQEDKKWIKHYENVAEYLYSDILGKEKYVFHRGSRFVKELYKKFNDINKTLSEPFANANKWNPADIWALSADVEEQEALKQIKSATDIFKLNNILIEFFNLKKIIGISLKKTGAAVHSTTYNTTEVRPRATFLMHNPGAGRKGIFAKDVYITGTYTQSLEDKEEDYSIQFRSFNPWTDFQGEIKGKSAALGKIAHGVINRVLRKNQTEVLPELEEIRDVAVNNTQNSSLIEEMFENFVSLGGKLNDVQDINQYKEKIYSGDTSVISEDYIFSKYFGLKLLKILSTLNSETKNKIMTDIIGYALSSSENSGPFIKIH